MNEPINYQIGKDDQEYQIGFRSSVIKVKEDSYFNSRKAKIILFNILVGQLIAVLGVGNGSIAKIIEQDYQCTIPLLLISSYYALLAFIWILRLGTMNTPEIYYFVITLFDSQANLLTVYSFSTIRFTYPFLINISSVFWTCIFTWLFINEYRYRITHSVGILISVLGIILSLYGSFNQMEDPIEHLFSNLKGLICCIIASIFYSISSIIQEKYFKSGEDIYNFFPWMGIFGFVLTFSESFFFSEITQLSMMGSAFNHNFPMLWAGFAVTLVCFAIISTFYIKRCTATMFNISLVSQIFWSYLVEVLFHDTPPRGYAYYIGFLVIIFGIYLFIKFPVDENAKYESWISTIKKHYWKYYSKKDNKISNGSDEIDCGINNVNEYAAFANTERKAEFYKRKHLATTVQKYLTQDTLF